MRQIRHSEIDMTQGSVVAQLIAFSIPLLLGEVFQQLYNTADTLIVGRFVSKQALAAVSATSNIVNILIGLFAGISTGATVDISNRFGAQDDTGLKRSVQTTLWFTAALGVAFTAVGIVFTPLMLRLLGTPEDVFLSARLYLTVYFAGVLGLVFYNMCSAILRATGDTRRPLCVLIICATVNTLLDLVFVLVVPFGVLGVGLATILSQFISAFILLRMMWNTEQLGMREAVQPHIDPAILRRILDVGLPVGLQKSIISFSNNIVASYVNRFGSGAMAAWGVHLRIDQLINHTVQSMSVATTTFVAQNLGAVKPERIRRGVRTAMLISLGISAIYAVIFVIFRDSIISCFNKDREVIAYGSTLILYLAPLQMINTVTQIDAGALRGEGDSKGPMFIMTFCFVAVRQLYLYLGFPKYGSFLFTILSYPFTWIVCALLLQFYIYGYKRHWSKTTSYLS